MASQRLFELGILLLGAWYSDPQYSDHGTTGDWHELLDENSNSLTFTEHTLYQEL